MRCPICSNDTDSADSNVTLCTTCQQINRTDLFSKILAILLDVYSANKGFDAIKDKCGQFYAIIKKYPLYVQHFGTFNPDQHDTDRVAVEYLRNYVISEDINIVQKHQPVKMDVVNNRCLYQTIAMLCQLDTEHGSRELRVRNVIDMVLNAEAYYSADVELHSCLKYSETWRYFVLEQLREKQLMNGPNSVLTLFLHSLSNILKMRIQSVYPQISGTSDDLRKRLDRTFLPLDVRLHATTISTITILWSNTKRISHCTSSMWMPDCVIPLLPLPECYWSNIMMPPQANPAALQSPAERRFYTLSCFCSVNQGMLNELVSYSDQQKHLEAEMIKGDAKVREFRCPTCSKTCENYTFNWQAVNIFRRSFTAARFTYIIVDVTWSMISNLFYAVTADKKTSVTRINRTKEAIKQLLKEIAETADPLDEAILTTFDEKLEKQSPLIPLCKAINIAEQQNLARIDAIELKGRRVDTHFYAALKEVYEILGEKAFSYVDLYIFSDGVDTSSKRNDKSYQAIIRGLNQRIGAKCHFMNCSSASNGFSVAAWLGDPEADCLLSGDIDQTKAQVKAAYKKDHPRDSNLPSRKTRGQGNTLDSPLPTPSTCMTDAEAASISKPRPEVSPKDESLPLNLSLQSSSSNRKNVDDYLANLPSATRAHSATVTDSGSTSWGIFKIVTRNFKPRKVN